MSEDEDCDEMPPMEIVKTLTCMPAEKYKELIAELATLRQQLAAAKKKIDEISAIVWDDEIAVKMETVDRIRQALASDGGKGGEDAH